MNSITRKKIGLESFLKAIGSRAYQYDVNRKVTEYAEMNGFSVKRVRFGITGKFKSPNYQAEFSDGSIVTFLGRKHRKDNVNATYNHKNLSSGFLYDGKTFVKIDE